MTTTKNIFFKSIKCHTFSEPQAWSALNDDDDNDDNDDDDDKNNNTFSHRNMQDVEIIC